MNDADIFLVLGSLSWEKVCETEKGSQCSCILVTTIDSRDCTHVEFPIEFRMFTPREDFKFTVPLPRGGAALNGNDDALLVNV